MLTHAHAHALDHTSVYSRAVNMVRAGGTRGPMVVDVDGDEG